MKKKQMLVLFSLRQMVRGALVAQLAECTAHIQRLSVLSGGHGFNSCLWSFGGWLPLSLNPISCLWKAVPSIKVKKITNNLHKKVGGQIHNDKVQFNNRVQMKH